jgi:tRNA 2-selenouridine synthase
MELPQIDDYERLFIEDIPMMDVRAPIEFEQGAFPHTKNLPLMNDEERHNIGIRYKEMGQDEAIELGHELVSGDTKRHRVEAWTEFTQTNPDGVLYCFRGGMRSKISQQWIYENTGVTYPRVKGGYKALRRYLLDELDTAAETIQPVILSGRTGTGKTVLLQQLQHQVDLEQIYNHRGSVFGIHVTPQPSQIDAENTLAITLLKFRHQGVTQLVFEDESANIGSRRIPENLYARFKTSPLVVLEATEEERVDITFDEYITSALREYQEYYGDEEGFNRWADYLMASIDKIQRRLGGERHTKLTNIMQDAITAHRSKNETEQHRQWIHNLLIDYYDPMYDYQLSKKIERLQFRGDKESILQYLRESYSID